jgi:hypothetical protein
MDTKQTATVMWEHYEGFRDKWGGVRKSFLGYTFETRTVYHNSKGYYVRVNGHRRPARPVGRTTPPTKFKALGTTTYQ